MKRAIDILFSLFGLVAFAPLLAVIALAVKWSSEGPVFFRQERMGMNFTPFSIYKFRTMRDGAQAEGPLVTSKGDVRVTPLGSFLRKYKLDELPQLINVLKGEMSFVGPRPEVRKYIELFRDDYKTLLAVRPGMTDPASVCFMQEEDALPLSSGGEEIYIKKILPEKIRISKQYLSNAGTLKDLGIITGTVFRSWVRAGRTDGPGKDGRPFTTSIYSPVRDFIIRRRRLVFAMTLLVQTVTANYLAFILRFESLLSPVNVAQFLTYIPLLLAIRLFFYLRAGLYKSLWRYAGIKDLVDILWTSAAGNALFMAAVVFIFGDRGYPRSIYIIDFLVFVSLSGGMRLMIRIFNEYMSAESPQKKVFIVGAGDAGEIAVRQMKTNGHRNSYEPVGFIDDDRYKRGLSIHGVPILGPKEHLPDLIRKHLPDEILVSFPCGPDALKRIYELSKPFNIPVKKLPVMEDILNGDVSIAPRIGQVLIDAGHITHSQLAMGLSLQRAEGGKLGSKLIGLGLIQEENLVSALQKQYVFSRIKPLSLEDLLQREPVRADIKSVREFIEGKSVFVTGAGGSIGSELSRQIMKYNPGRLVLLDRYENNLFHIDMELRRGGAACAALTSAVGDIQDPLYIEYLFSRHNPQIVFHAAAYKHVPLMESNVVEAVKNNVLGTRNLLHAADRHGVESFVAISTDKAVNPTSVMGATKRLAEFLTIAMNRLSGSRFSVVRFGNVLGTNGSVVPIFREQLAKGGPLTVTHPEVKRFFMLIPEAMQLVLIAGASGRGGEIFVLDMGEPVKILDLAENFVRLSGLVPHKEIKIEFSGLRPGEKLFEELFDASETILPTSHEKLKMAVSSVPSNEELEAMVKELEDAVHALSADDVIDCIRRAVPNFQGILAKTEEINLI
ncbi:MAG: polysaccharide biosynthesis protein [Nitrospiraceae bacterium]|nr:polysaccharide biosynthesis protein [Nitrospiraceae bacterium]